MVVISCGSPGFTAFGGIDVLVLLQELGMCADGDGAVMVCSFL